MEIVSSKKSKKATSPLHKLKDNEVTVTMTEFDLFVLGRISRQVGGNSDARAVFSDCMSDYKPEQPLSALAQEYFGYDTFADLTRLFDNEFDSDGLTITTIG